MFKVLPRVKRFGTAIIGPQSEKKVSSLANPFRGLGGGVRGRVEYLPRPNKFLLFGYEPSFLPLRGKRA
jgi:hypothetical protein